MTELARYTCPSCETTFDVWLEDGVPEKPPWCPNHLAFGVHIIARLDSGDSSLWGPDDDDPTRGST
jgi:hypothetical protein